MSKDIVGDLINNLESRALGGSGKNVAALFSDIKSFSPLPEKLDNHGTIGKYIDKMPLLVLGDSYGCSRPRS